MPYKLISILILILISFSLQGCLFSYLVKSGYEQMKMMSKREPISKALKNPNIDQKTKRKLELALEARKFAEKKLNLKPTDNYTSFVDLKRPYVTYVLRVSPYDELKAHLWSFPMVGKMPYKGFFSKAEALEESDKFPKDKYDTYVRGVTAYSTLGWFDDPLLSSMLTYSDHDLVNVIIHETVHATVFIKGQADFNESLATYLGNVGTELFYKQKEGEESSTLKKIKNENLDDKYFSVFIQKELSELEKWYKDKKKKATSLSVEEKLSRLTILKENFDKNLSQKLVTSKYKDFPKMELNNARLLSYKTYFQDLTDFEKLSKMYKDNFEQILIFCKSLEKSKDPIKFLKEHIKH